MSGIWFFFTRICFFLLCFAAGSKAADWYWVFWEYRKKKTVGNYILRILSLIGLLGLLIIGVYSATGFFEAINV